MKRHGCQSLPLLLFLILCGFALQNSAANIDQSLHDAEQIEPMALDAVEAAAIRWGTVYSSDGCKYLTSGGGLRLTGAGTSIPDGTWVSVIGILYYTSRCTGIPQLTMKVEIIFYP